MKLTAYVEDGFELDIRPARPDRAWLEAYGEGYAYGCLPMVMANQLGWEICTPTGFTVVWNGGGNRDSLAVIADEPDIARIISHFGAGIFTFSFPAVFRTEPGYDLMIQGPPNTPVRGATPFSGLMETDWALTSAAIHWQITEPNMAVRFRKGDAMAQIFPVRRGDTEAFEPEIRSISDAPEIAEYMEEWTTRRRAFNKALKDPDSAERRKKWPGHYRRGTDIFDNKASPETHRTRVRVSSFKDKRGPKPED
jgi:uncharacterized protein DUF6065